MKIVCFALIIISILSHEAFAQVKPTKQLKILRKVNDVEGRPTDDNFVLGNGTNFGRTPSITVIPNKDNTVTIAWVDTENKHIHISIADKNDSIVREVKSHYFEKLKTQLDGFTIIPKDTSFIVGYEQYPGRNLGSEFWICRLNSKGDTIWTRKIFGGTSMDLAGSKCCPGSGGTARIAYNTKTNMICYFLGHSQKWSDQVIHQASYIGFISLDGVISKTGNKWYISHDFDQRIVSADSTFYLLSLGDAYPRSIVFSSWTQNRKYVFSEILKIPGQKGDNYTGIRIGSMIQLSDGNFGILFASKIERQHQDICFMKVSKKGTVIFTKWYTNDTKNDMRFPKIATRGQNRTLIAWRNSYSSVVFEEIDNLGKIISTSAITNDYRYPNTYINFSLTHDMVTCPNGDIVWASGDINHKKLTIYRIKK